MKNDENTGQLHIHIRAEGQQELQVVVGIRIGSTKDGDGMQRMKPIRCKARRIAFGLQEGSEGFGRLPPCGVSPGSPSNC